jgi:hypothetical protein
MGQTNCVQASNPFAEKLTVSLPSNINIEIMEFIDQFLDSNNMKPMNEVVKTESFLLDQASFDDLLNSDRFSCLENQDLIRVYQMKLSSFQTDTFPLVFRHPKLNKHNPSIIMGRRQVDFKNRPHIRLVILSYFKWIDLSSTEEFFGLFLSTLPLGLINPLLGLVNMFKSFDFDNDIEAILSQENIKDYLVFKLVRFANTSVN